MIHLVQSLLWRIRCPKAKDDIAKHFAKRVSNWVEVSELDFTEAFADYQDPWFAWRRMISSVYGVAIGYRAPDEAPAKRGLEPKAVGSAISAVSGGAG